jgi:predicted transcriptional regulator
MVIHYTEKKLEQLLSIGESEEYLFMPNEIFEDLLKIEVIQKNRSAAHRAYAYAYVFLTYYLWRFAKYGGMDDYPEDLLKKILNRSPIDKKINYITKSKGELEELGYIRKVRDFPISYTYFDSYEEARGSLSYVPNGKKEVEFIMYSEYEWAENRKNKRINYPVKGMEDRVILIQDGELAINGVFYDIEKTHKVTIQSLIYCLTREELGVEAFYLYSYIQMMTQIHKHGWHCPKASLIERTGLTEHSIKKHLRALEEYNMIKVTHQDFVVNLDPSKQMPANSYKALDHSEFIPKHAPKNKIDVRKVYSQATYEKLYGKIGGESTDGLGLELDDLLPF